MLCKNPYMAGTNAFGCGQCLPCRVNLRRQWMWRQVLESMCHDHNCFITLTYDRAHIRGDWSLDRRHVQLFVKSLRAAIYPTRIRFYACGEYGEQNKRPHYHLSVFGLSASGVYNDKPIALYRLIGGRERCVGGIIHDAWGRGFVDVAEFNHLTAQYVCGYVVKKLKDRKNGEEWNYPEFAAMSNRPGLGNEAMRIIARKLNSNYQNWATGDVPAELLIGKRRVPLGRYLLRSLRQYVGFSSDYQKEVRDRVSYERSIQMHALFANTSGDGTFKATYLDDIEGELQKVEARAKLQKGKTL